MFTLKIPRSVHGDLAAELAKLSHVTLHSANKPGVVEPPDGKGLVFEFNPIPGKDEVNVVVTKNPNNTPESEIKARLEADVNRLLGGESVVGA